MPKSCINSEAGTFALFCLAIFRIAASMSCAYIDLGRVRHFVFDFLLMFLPHCAHCSTATGGHKGSVPDGS